MVAAQPRRAIVMRYEVKGTDPESGRPVTVELGWSEGEFYYGIDNERGQEIGTGFEIYSVADLISETRGYIQWTRQLYQAMRDAAVADYLEKNPPADPVA